MLYYIPLIYINTCPALENFLIFLISCFLINAYYFNVYINLIYISINNIK